MGYQKTPTSSSYNNNNGDGSYGGSRIRLASTAGSIGHMYGEIFICATKARSWLMIIFNLCLMMNFVYQDLESRMVIRLLSHSRLPDSYPSKRVLVVASYSVSSNPQHQNRIGGYIPIELTYHKGSHIVQRVWNRYDAHSGGEREIQRTMLELLYQLDGFDSRGDVKVILATNKIEILEAAWLEPGPIDRKIEFPHPDIKTRRRIPATMTLNCISDLKSATQAPPETYSHSTGSPNQSLPKSVEKQEMQPPETIRKATLKRQLFPDDMTAHKTDGENPNIFVFQLLQNPNVKSEDLRWMLMEPIMLSWTSLLAIEKLPRSFPNALFQLSKKIAAPAMPVGEDFQPKAANFNYFGSGWFRLWSQNLHRLLHSRISRTLNSRPPHEKIAEAHKAEKFAVEALAFDNGLFAVDYPKESLELLTNSASV